MAGAEERAFPAAPVAYGSNKVIASPFQFALTDDDNLQIVTANSRVGVVLAVQGRRLTTKGQIEQFAFSHTPNSDRTTKTENFHLGAGALLNLTIYVSSGVPRTGQTYVSARLIRGLTGGLLLLGGLLGGYVAASQPLSYPGSPITSTWEGGGYQRDVIGTSPAAGVEVNESVPTGARWELFAMRAVLNTNAAVVDRRPRLNIENAAGTVVAQLVSPGTQNASATNSYYWVQGLPLTTMLGGTALAGLPERLELLPGARFWSQTDNLQAGDNWAPIVYTVKEWLEVTA